MVKETGIWIKSMTCNKSLKLDNINMIKMYRVHLDINYLLFHIMFILNSLTSYFDLLIK